jgi:biotin carboxylase
LASGIVLYLGMVRRGEFESLSQHGVPLGVLVDTNSKQRLADVSTFAAVERFDFSRPRGELIETVRSIQQRFGIQCLFNVVEFYVEPTAEVAAALSLPSISPASARMCLDKSAMRQRFQERIGPNASARFHVVASEDDLLKSADGLGYPVFLQPSNVSASMWSTLNTSPQMLLEHFRAMKAEVPAYYQRLGQRGKELKVVLAEFLEGSNTSIDCLIDQSGKVYTTPVVDVLTGRDVGIDDFHHFARLLPSRLTADEQAHLMRLAVDGVKALDMTNSAAHVEFIGAKLGEIGARPGGNRPRILEMAYGIDALYSFYQILTGRAPDLRASHQRAAAIVTPFAPRNGILQSIRYLDRLASLPGYLYHEVRAQGGQAVGLAKSGYRAPLYVELLSDSADDVRRSVDQIASWTDLYVIE